MSSVDVKDLRSGQKVKVESEPYTVVSTEFVKPGKGQAFCRIRLKHLMTERVLDRNFKSGEKIELADVEEIELRFLYISGNEYCFMNDETFEQLSVSEGIVGKGSVWIKDDTLYTILFYNGQPIQVTPPTFMDFVITSTEAGVRGDTTSGRVMKQAILENGYQIEVPLFMDSGESIRVDTRDGTYESRTGK
ncbi:elongation factor P [Candidatus Similichlamydia epinepheli]|uniref:elongation factor P n=1 Tax=Candidatus Similichlamydia epinepheli TaxID=1903953 RepID=UPI000D33D8C5|nr:elongation factor P [Candidatus Similichlamydia epinepheli]